MGKENLSDKADAVRLAETEAAWIDEWVADTGQDRSLPLRAGVRLLRYTVRDLTFEAKVRLVTRLAEASPDETAEAELWAAQAVKTMEAINKGKHPTR